MTTKTESYLTNANEDRDSYCTPKWLADAIGPVWIDVCTNGRSHIQASRDFRLERGQDALRGARYISRDPPGLVFCNPPYSAGNVMRFVRAFRHTRFCFLIRMDTSTMWWHELFPRVELVCISKKRINFDAPPNVEIVGSGSNPFPHALLYARAADATPAVLDQTFPLRTFDIKAFLAQRDAPKENQ